MKNATNIGSLILFFARICSAASFYGGNLPTQYGSLSAMSDDGRIFILNDGYNNLTRYMDGTTTEILTYIDTVGDISSDALTIVGREGDRAFHWDNGDMTFFDNPKGCFESEALSISNDKSTITGQSSFGDYSNFNISTCLWKNDSYLNIGYLDSSHNFSTATGLSSDGSVVIGFSGYKHKVEGRLAFRYENDQMQSLGDLTGGYIYRLADAISADGSTIAGRSKSASGIELFVWEDNDIANIGLYESAYVDFVSPDGSFILGWTSDNGLFFWNETNGLRDFEEALQNDYNLDLTGWSLWSITGMNSNGMKIYGTGSGPSGENYWVAEIPEPATILLLSLGGLFLRRKH